MRLAPNDSLEKPRPSSWEELPLMLDVGDMQGIFGVSAKTISRWALSGQIPPATVRAGQITRWDKRVVMEHIARRQRAR